MHEVPAVNLPSTFDQIYEAYRTLIYIHLYRLVGDREQAEDLTQETFVKALRALPRLEGEVKVGPWLYCIATNTALDALRRRKRVSWLSLSALEVDLADTEMADPLQAYVGGEMVREALKGLPEHYRQALVLSLLEGYSAREVAEILQKGEGGAKMFLLRARGAFRKQYEALQRREAVPVCAPREAAAFP